MASELYDWRLRTGANELYDKTDDVRYDFQDNQTLRVIDVKVSGKKHKPFSFKDCSELESIVISSKNDTYDVISSISGCPKLERIEIYGCTVALDASDLKSLKNLIISSGSTVKNLDLAEPLGKLEINHSTIASPLKLPKSLSYFYARETHFDSIQGDDTSLLVFEIFDCSFQKFKLPNLNKALSSLSICLDRKKGERYPKVKIPPIAKLHEFSLSGVTIDKMPSKNLVAHTLNLCDLKTSNDFEINGVFHECFFSDLENNGKLFGKIETEKLTVTSCDVDDSELIRLIHPKTTYVEADVNSKVLIDFSKTNLKWIGLSFSPPLNKRYPNDLLPSDVEKVLIE